MGQSASGRASAGLGTGENSPAVVADRSVGVDVAPDIVHVDVDRGYRLVITFADSQRRAVDIDSLVQFDGVFEPLRDLAYFARVSVNNELGTIVWPNGADLCPDVLRQSGVALP